MILKNRGEHMAGSYVLFETPKELVAKALEALTIAADSGRVKKGANETTKSIEAKNSILVVIAQDVEPAEVVMHLPALCKEKSIPFIYVPTKKELGGALGLPVPCAAASVEQAGNASELIDAIIKKAAQLSGVNPTQSAAAQSAKKEEPKSPEHKAQKQTSKQRSKK
jgi:large subunit ribosomal protein L7Ae